MKRAYTPSQIKKITGATGHEKIHIPFYYAPPFLDELREWIKSNLSSRGGRPTIKGLKVIRKVRFSQRNWKELQSIAKRLSKSSGVSISPSQVTTSILEKAVEEIKQEEQKLNETTD